MVFDFYIIGIIFLFGHGPRQSWSSLANQDFERQLVQKLVGGNYSKLFKPTFLNNDTFTVKTKLYLVRIQKIDEASETFHSTIRLQLTWQDPKLSWIPAEFGGMREVVVPAGKLWIPPFHIANSVDGSADTINNDSKFPFRLNSDGRVWYHPTARASTKCRFLLTYYPFDAQMCMIIIESEIYQEHELVLEIRTRAFHRAVSFGMLSENDVWELLREYTYGIPKIYQSGSRTKFSRVQYVITMKRKPAFFVITVLVPTLILGITTLLTYFVPVHYIDRPVLSVTTVLAVVIFSSSVAEKLPSNSANCLLTIYLTTIMCASAITVLTTTICLTIIDPGEHISAPWGIPNIARAVTGYLSQLWHKVLKRFSKFKEEASLKPENIGLATTGGKDYLTFAGRKRSIEKFDVDDSNDLDEKIGGFDNLGYFPDYDNLCFTDLNSMERSDQSHPSLPMFRRRHAITGDKADLKMVYQAGCKFVSTKKSWYVAYTINWIGFFICFAATTGLPLMALINASNTEIFAKHSIAHDKLQVLEELYFGDS